MPNNIPVPKLQSIEIEGTPFWCFLVLGVILKTFGYLGTLITPVDISLQIVSNWGWRNVAPLSDVMILGVANSVQAEVIFSTQGAP
jgi:hypothetical protein